MKILMGSADTDIAFSELCQLLIRLGFTERIKGSHHIFTREDIEEIINLQPKHRKAKPYQIKQIRMLLTKYRMGEYDID
ncbi:type II toxin-antitoxin system HicA family toxin [Nitrosomonas sp.]|uniref:type II toxin-antitoxin system HicA family toxin n=1 Tax=Nitrosomonas sp. TaxID=42353 RepID=UPI0025DDD33B|nr:type II toxin-antitoxin system HicA family toxin [Nitrosomonas sp.]